VRYFPPYQHIILFGSSPVVVAAGPLRGMPSGGSAHIPHSAVSVVATYSTSGPPGWMHRRVSYRESLGAANH